MSQVKTNSQEIDELLQSVEPLCEVGPEVDEEDCVSPASWWVQLYCYIHGFSEHLFCEYHYEDLRQLVSESKRVGHPIRISREERIRA